MRAEGLYVESEGDTASLGVASEFQKPKGLVLGGVPAAIGRKVEGGGGGMVKLLRLASLGVASWLTGPRILVLGGIGIPKAGALRWGARSPNIFGRLPKEGSGGPIT